MSGKYEHWWRTYIERNEGAMPPEAHTRLHFASADAKIAKKNEQLRVLAHQIRSVPLRRNPCTDELECVHPGCMFGVYQGGDPMHGHSPDCPVTLASEILEGEKG